MRFGHLGDQVFALAVTDAIQELHPHLRVGPASVSRCAVFPLSSSGVSHDYYTESEGSY